jgi:enoyl-CoA hydratase/carnithine racemase
MIEVTQNERVVHLAIDAPPVNVMDTAVMDELTEQLQRCAGEDDQ